MTRRLFILVLIALLAGCGNPTATLAPDALANTSWILDTLHGEPVEAAAGITLAFSAGNALNGSDGCNDYTAGYTINGSNLVILAPVGTTRKSCPPSVLEQSTAYLQALTEAASYRQAADKLELLATDGSVVASFQRVVP